MITKRPDVEDCVSYTNPAGERCEVLVELGPDEALDMLWSLASGRQAGHPDGPIAARYAIQRAMPEIPDKFSELHVERVVTH